MSAEAKQGERIEDLKEKALDDSKAAQVKGGVGPINGIGPIDGKKPPLPPKPAGPIDA